jgi:hypothetical protein
MTALIVTTMINAHETGLFRSALAGLSISLRRALGGRGLVGGRESRGKNVGASDRNWRLLLQTSDLWRYL